ncbi:hypothetical protein [Alishewanella sp. SMS8]|uniref:hypothetical protein n=1 Tax=Alishewanella sp. SMS8 TaxID=2994676 RepID=UPI0027425D83|nr:hypothetical protein [Alishewanella sp. SMS8]MDP5206338.1 hypothetical protein [Alishewanella sp. SMS9]MDP5459897.1 hypothetical protein [Alishewanella sp. SMS8]
MSNQYQRLRGLTQAQPRTIGTVTSHNADGTSSVQLLSGAFVTVLGQSVAVSSRAYIEGGRVIGQAASLPFFNIDI